MKPLEALAWLGRLLGLVGIVVCAFAGLLRLAGHYTLSGFPVLTLFEGGTAVLIAGCFCLLWVLATRR